MKSVSRAVSLALVSASLCSATHVTANAEPVSESAASSSVAERTEQAIARGAAAAASGIERGMRAAASGVERGVKAAAHGVAVGASAAARGIDRGAQATANVAEKAAAKVGAASDPESGK